MRNSQRYSLVKLTSMLIISFWMVTACYFEESRSSLPVQNDTYAIDTKLILTSIAQGTDDAFVPIDISSELDSTPPSDPVHWTQADYLKIADALHKFVWSESLDNWTLNSMSFGVLCDEVQNGLQDARFVFFNVLNSNEGNSRIVHNIIIDPEKNSVNVWAIKYSPIVMNWKTIELIKIKVSADEALQLAEVNGGMNKRNAIKNACNISVSLIPDSDGYEGWQVDYYENPGTLFQLEVDPVTGKFK